MAIPGVEYRERIVAYGCDEDVTRVIISLIDAADDDVVAEGILEAIGSLPRTGQLLNDLLSRRITLSEAGLGEVG